jgi:hypothetical protein
MATIPASPTADRATPSVQQPMHEQSFSSWDGADCLEPWPAIDAWPWWWADAAPACATA